MEYFHGFYSSSDVNPCYDINHHVQVCAEVSMLMDSRLEDTDMTKNSYPFTVEKKTAVDVM